MRRLTFTLVIFSTALAQDETSLRDQSDIFTIQTDTAADTMRTLTFTEVITSETSSSVPAATAEVNFSLLASRGCPKATDRALQT